MCTLGYLGFIEQGPKFNVPAKYQNTVEGP